MWIEHHFTPVCTNSILVCPLLSPMNAILRLKESGELVAMSRDTRYRDLRVIRIVGIKKNNSQNNFSMRCETRKLKKKEIYQSPRIPRRSKCRSHKMSTLCKFAPCIGFLSRWSRKQTCHENKRRENECLTIATNAFPNDAERPLAYRHTCFKWLIGSMNECYIEINQDFTKVKTTTNSILISRLVYDCNFLYNASNWRI